MRVRSGSKDHHCLARMAKVRFFAFFLQADLPAAQILCFIHPALKDLIDRAGGALSGRRRYGGLLVAARTNADLPETLMRAPRFPRGCPR